MGDDLVQTQRFLDVTVRLGRKVMLAQGPTRVQVLVETRPVASSVGAPPVDLRLVLDESGSMDTSVNYHGGDSKMDVVKQAALQLLGDLTVQDRLLLAAFANQGRLLMPSQHVTASVRGLAIALIDDMSANGGTYISGGLQHAMLREDPSSIPRIILFTDGESTFRTSEDLVQLVQLADQARDLKVPLLIYGTGEDYNWHLLKQLAARAGHGSFLKHVTDATVLKDHLTGELAFLRGTAIDRLRITGATPKGVKIVSVTALTPQQRDLPQAGEQEGLRDMYEDHRFVDAAGSMDVHRGQQYLIILDVEDPKPGAQRLIRLSFEGRIVASGQRFIHPLRIAGSFTGNPDIESPVDTHVLQVMQKMAAARKAEEGDYQRAADLYDRAGDGQTADTMRTLYQQSLAHSARQEDLRRTASTLATGTLTQTYTVRERDSDTLP